MRASWRLAAGLLASALVLAVATPWLLAYLRPTVAPYLLHPSVFLVQGLPYGLAATLLVPRWRWGSDTVSVLVAGLMLTIALALYVPILAAPERWGGDMIALAFLAMSGGTTAVLVVASALAAVVAWLQRRRSGSSGVAP